LACSSLDDNNTQCRKFTQSKCWWQLFPQLGFERRFGALRRFDVSIEKRKTVVIEQIRYIAHRSQARKLLNIGSMAPAISLSRRDCDVSALP
jgi:hypothetical protein